MSRINEIVEEIEDHRQDILELGAELVWIESIKGTQRHGWEYTTDQERQQFKNIYAGIESTIHVSADNGAKQERERND